MALYVVRSTANITLAAAGTAKTLVNVISGSSAVTFKPTTVHVSFNGTDVAKEPFLVELCKSTQAGAGTSTSQTPVQVDLPTRAAQASGQINYTAEPTVLTVLHPFLLSPAGGHLTLQNPLGREAVVNNQGYCLRVTIPTGTTGTFTAVAFIEFEE